MIGLSSVDIDRVITLGQGLTLVFFSVSGMKCLNRKQYVNKNGCCSTEAELNICDNSFKCSLANMNLGLSTMGATGIFMACKSLLY